MRSIENGSSPFVAAARLDNRDDLAVSLSLAPSALARTSDSMLIEQIYRRFGDDGVANLLGSFTFVHWDEHARRLTLGRDCLGCAALFFYVGRYTIAFATRLNTLLAFPDVPREIDELALANFMAINYLDTSQTFYRGIQRVPSRTIVTIDRNGLHKNQYWMPKAAATRRPRPDQDYVDEARGLLDQAVATAARGTSNFAISTSGGLDSSGIAATAARLQLADRIDCYTGVPLAGEAIEVGRERYVSEANKVRALARMYPALDVRLVTPDGAHPFEADDTRLFARVGLPIHGPTNHGWFSHINDKIRAGGHHIVLHGLRGNHGLSWSGEFSLVDLLRSGKWLGLAHELAATSRESGRGMLDIFRREILTPTTPLPVARAVRRLRGQDPDSVRRFCALNPDVIADLDLPRRWRDENYDPWHVTRSTDAAQWRTYHLFDYNQAGRDLHALWPDIHGFELRDPLADRRLLEFVLAVPETLFRQNGVPRSFARRVLADRLPPEIINERRRGAQAINWFRSLNARKHEIALDIERLEGSPLASRMVDVARLKQLMAEWPEDEDAAVSRSRDYNQVLGRGVHMGRFIRWVEGGNG
ncbi:MAG TPA: asparagine synthetase B family protein [Humisphaera sp.]|nr:asparagine synthetase B family protein [Humisphaera sp.]